jgi:hypothetical protein
VFGFCGRERDGGKGVWVLGFDLGGVLIFGFCVLDFILRGS